MLREDLEKRILVLDGAMGTVLQKYSLSPEDFCGVQGCYEILNESRADIIQEIHERYIEAGADLIETNSFNCNAISLKKYGLENKVRELAKKSVEIAKKATQKFERKIYIVGAIGPTDISLSLCSQDDDSKNSLTFQELKKVYIEQIQALCEEGIDALLMETIYDELNAKAALCAATEVFGMIKREFPILVSVTVNQYGKLLTGQDVESFIRDVDNVSILSFGFNCSFGVKDLVPFVTRLRNTTNKYISLYPSAGLPNENGEYPDTIEQMKECFVALLETKSVNILGGCCGTSFEHIRVIKELVENYETRLPKKNS